MELALFIEDFIRRYLENPATNNLGEGAHEKAWGDFILGFSDGADPLYEELKERVGEFHWTPLEAFALGKADPMPTAEDLTVVSFALCQTEASKASNRNQTFYPSERWARARVYGQACNRRLHLALVKTLEEMGHQALAPSLLPEFCESRSQLHGLASSWSERHVAYVSGLGTFGLAGGLITAKGQAARFGSIIVRARIPATPRLYSGPFAYCLHYALHTCATCADRCPSASITRETRDKEACADHLDHSTASHVRNEYGFAGYGCGLCQTGVPCESGIPYPLTATS